MRKSKASIIISKISVIVLFLGLLGCVVFARQLSGLYLDIVGRQGEELTTALRILIYVAGVIGTILLALMYKLLDNVHRDIIFEDRNVKLLKAIQYICYCSAAVIAVFTPYFIFAAAVALAAAFVGLLIRVITNVFQSAVQIKQENDFTI
ncbi:MAG: DUF2975 domain-containing protein [Clostridia bacterium]|nr:DUF2975 domain-containing protein [Clostridia bacterium]